MRYSAFNVLKKSVTGHKGWKPVRRSPAPKPAYDIITTGGGKTV